MLTASDISGFSDSIIDIYSQVEIDIMNDIARRIVKTGYLTQTAQWQLKKAKELGMLQGDIEATLAAATGMTKKEIHKIFLNAGVKAVGKAALKTDAMEAIMLQGESAVNKLMVNLTRSTSVTSIKALSSALDRAYLQVMSGAFTRQQAIKMAITDLAKNGITSLAYGNGPKPTSYASIEAGVRRAVTTGVNQTCAKLQIQRARDLETDLVITSEHSGARPEHAVWQGGIYGIDGKVRGYDSLVDATGYGTGAGLCGWNCYHTFWPYVEGKSTNPHDDDTDYGNNEAYKQSQKQRYYERAVREAKREVATIRSAIDASDDATLNSELEQELNKSTRKLRNRQAKLRDYCESIGVRIDYNRTYVAGYNKPIEIKPQNAP